MSKQPGEWCAMCLFPDDVAKLKTDAACCTGCRVDCVCLDRVWYGKRQVGASRRTSKSKAG